MHSLYQQAVDTMDLEHVNHFEREGVLPIAFSLFHYVNVHDGSFMMITTTMRGLLAGAYPTNSEL